MGQVSDTHRDSAVEAAKPVPKSPTVASVLETSTSPQLVEPVVRHLLHITKDTTDHSLLVFEVVISGQRFKALIDSGASGSFLSTRVANQLKLKKVVKGVPDVVRLADGSTLESTHVLRMQFDLGEFSDSETFHILDLPDHDVVLGRPWLRRINPDINWKTDTMQITHKGRKHILHTIGDDAGKRIAGLLMNAMEVKKAHARGDDIFLVSLKQLEDADGTLVQDSLKQDPSVPQQFKDKMSALVDTYRDVVPSDPEWMPDFPPERDVDHTIELKPGAPLPNRPMYRMSQPELVELRKQLDDLLAKGYIQPSSSPYASPVLLVRKPGSTTLRMCIDFRQLNSATKKCAYPVPPLHECLDRMHGAKFFSKLDCAQGFHQIRLDPVSQQLCAFRCRYGLFEFKVMPFGLCNAPATFQRLVDSILMPYLDKFCCVYMDDILIWSDDEESHCKHVALVLDLLRKHKLYCRPHKCEFGVTSTRYLGHIVSVEGIHVDPDKIKAIVDWPVPKNVKEVMAFKGLAEFYRRFVRDFSRIAAPLSVLTGTAEFRWGEAEQEAFEALKHALTTTPILAPPDYSRPFKVATDASKFAIGAVLTQGEGEHLRVVAYESRKMIDAETRYPVHDKELLAVIHALKKWDYHLRGQRFVIETDNWATKYIQTKPNLNHRQMNWMSTLQSFDCDFVHRPGKDNVVADALSRRSDHVDVDLDGLSPPPVISFNALTWLKPDDGLLTSVRASSVSDPEYQRILAVVTAKKRTDFSLTDELLYKGGRLYVPQCDLRARLLSEAHDAPLSGHLGRDKTYDRLSRAFYWPRMHLMVSEYCSTCPSCQAIKPSHQKPMGLLQPLPIPTSPGESFGLDFIMGLPRTKSGYTAICTFTDRCSHTLVLAPTTEEVTAEQTAGLFHRDVFRRGFGIPQSLVSDRDPRFTSEFWQALHKRFGTKLNMSTANHPQTDGCSENANRTVEDMIRHFVSPFQDDWDEHLVNLEFCYNDSVHASTGYTPFQLTQGRHPRTPLNMYLQPLSETSTETVKVYAKRLREDIQRARAAMLAAQERQRRNANKHRRQYTFEVGDLVWLAASHLRLRRLVTGKLKPRYYGPYKIKRVLSEVAYELALPAAFKIHPVIHISHLKANADGTKSFPHRPEYEGPPPPELEDDEPYFAVECFRQHRGTAKRRQFLVKFVGEGEDYNEWLRASRLREDMPNDYDRLVAEYVQRTGAQL